MKDCIHKKVKPVKVGGNDDLLAYSLVLSCDAKEDSGISSLPTTQTDSGDEEDDEEDEEKKKIKEEENYDAADAATMRVSSIAQFPFFIPIFYYLIFHYDHISFLTPLK